MIDTHTPEQRAGNMSVIRSKSHLEDKVAKELWKRGIRFRRNVRVLGKHDIAIKSIK